MSNLMGMLLRLLARWAGIEIRPLPDPRPMPAPGPTPAPGPIPVPSPPPPGPSAPADPPGLIAALNAARAASSLPALTEDETLDGSASSWARLMASGRGLTHGDFAARITAYAPNSAAGEDIAEGQPTAAAVVAAWMDSPPHRANILGGFTKVGVGSSPDDSGAIYWCVDFVGD